MTDILGPANASAVTTRIPESRVFPVGDTWFKPCTNAAAADGTQLQSVFFNGLLAQLRAAIRGNGKRNDGVTPVIAEDNTNDGMLLGAIQALVQRGQTTFGLDTGTADAMVIAPSPAVAEYKAGARFVVLKNALVGGNATTTPTIAISGLAPVTVVKPDGSALGIGDLKKAVAFEILLDGTYARLVSLLALSDIAAQTRINAPGPITLYVRTDGDDRGNGSANDVYANVGTNCAFKTLQAAYNFLTKSYNPGFTATIQLGIQGTYAGLVALNNGVTGQISIFGDQSAGQGSQGSYIITPVAFSTGYSCVLSAVQTVTLDGVTLDASSLNAGQSVQIARAGGQGALVMGRHTARYSGNNPNVTVYSADPAASLNFSQNPTVAVGTVGSVIGSLGQVGVLNSAGVTMAMANATFSSFANVQGGTTNLQSMAFSGSGNTGSKYSVSNEATLLPPTSGGYAAIPGSTAGSVTLGGGYVAGDPGPAWTQFNTSINSTGGQFGSAAVFMRYQRWGKSVYFMAQISIGTVGGASGAIVTQLPIAPQGGYSFCGVEAAVNGKSVSVRPQAGGGQVQINNYDGTSAIVAGGLYYITGVYEAAN